MERVLESKSRSDNWNTETMREILKRIIETEEVFEETYSFEHPKLPKIIKKEFSPTVSFANPSNLKPQYSGSSNSSKTRNCRLCSGEHAINFCNVYNTAKDRIRRIRELKLCLRCLRSQHPGSDCVVSNKCFYCSGNHLKAFCFKFENDQLKNKSPKTNKRSERYVPRSTVHSSFVTESKSREGPERRSE